MKKILLSLFATAALTANAQETIFFEDFESYTNFTITDFGGWKQHDLDGGETWAITDVTFPNQNYIGAGIIFNNSQATGSTTAMNPYAGQKGLYFFASGANQTAYPNNDWTISPKISLVGVTGGKLELYAKGNQLYGPDRFNISVSTSQDLNTFTTFLNSTPVVPPSTGYTKYTFDLSAYDGQEVYIAINCTTNDGLYLMIDNFRVYKPSTIPPNCATLTLPANNATNQNYLSQVLSWTAPASGSEVEGYDVFLDKNPDPTTLVGSSVSTTFTVTNLDPSSTYYWKVLPKNTAGSATGCTIYSFTTMAPTYCTAGATSTSFEKISNVTFSNINNSSTSGAGYEDFTSVVGNVTAGETYNFTASFTGTSYDADHVLVWIDLNNDKDFNDPGEQVLVTATKKSPWTGSITIPAGATVGTTRMRVRLNDSGSGSSNITPCGTSLFGQVEDYTLNIGQLAVSETAKAPVKAYPNPVKDIFNIEAQGKIKSVKVYDVTGKQLLTKDLNDAKSQIDFSRFGAGTYLVTTLLEDGTSTSTKVIKK